MWPDHLDYSNREKRDYYILLSYAQAYVRDPGFGLLRVPGKISFRLPTLKRIKHRYCFVNSKLISPVDAPPGQVAV